MQVAITSVNRPEKLYNTIKLLVDNASRPTMFADFDLLLEEGQEGVYEETLKKIDDLGVGYSLSYIEPKKGDISHLYLCQFNKFLKTDNYFLWYLPDDMTRIPKNWDRTIKKKYKYFEDGLFCLYGKYNVRGRNEEVFKSCYALDLIDFSGISPYFEKEYKKSMNDLWLAAHNFGDMFPVYTRKWVEFLMKVFEDDYHTHCHDIASSILIKILCDKYDHLRNIKGLRIGLDCDDDRKIGPMIEAKRMKLDVLYEVAELMSEYISTFKEKRHEKK